MKTTKTVNGVDFVWVPGYNEYPGHWLSIRRNPIVRVYPNKNKTKWKTTKGKIEEVTGTYEDAENKVWQQAAQWVKGPAGR